jgi:hypothetical protein
MWLTEYFFQVHIGPDDWMSESALHSKKPWRAVLARRRWRSGYNAGGSPNYIGKLSSVIQLFLVKALLQSWQHFVFTKILFFVTRTCFFTSYKLVTYKTKKVLTVYLAKNTYICFKSTTLSS